MTQEQINELLVARGAAGLEVVRLKGGDPFVFGRGGEEAEACRAAGVPFEVVPGVTSAIAAPAYAGIPVTHRGLSTSFTVVTGHEDPTKGGTDTDWDALARAGGTLVVLMGAGRVAEIAQGADRGRPRRGARRSPRCGGARGPSNARSAARSRRSRTLGVESPSAIVSATSPASISAGSSGARCSAGRVVVTRAREQASELRARLEQLGAEVIELPSIALEPDRLRAARRSPRTSGSCSRRPTASTRSSTAASRPPGSTPARSRRSRVAAIGPGTARALARRGIRADLVPERFVAESLLDAFPDPRAPARGCCSPARSPPATCCPTVSRRAATRSTCSRCTGPSRSRPTPPTSRACAPARSTRSRSRRRRRSQLLRRGRAARSAVRSVSRSDRSRRRRPATRGLRVDAEADPHTIDGLVDALLTAVARLRARSALTGTLAACRSPSIGCAGCGARPRCGGWSPSTACASTTSSPRCS